MKGKKLLVLATTGLLTAVALTGCGKKKSDPKPDPTPTPEPGPEPTPDPTLADGVFSYVNAPAAERTKILGLLEKYAVENKISGLTIFNNGGYSLYNPGLHRAASSYIPGYGWGILGDGDITADLEGESNAAWKRYLHSATTDNPDQMNYMNDKGSVVGTLNGYASSSYFTTKLNQDKDGYVWVGETATVDRPIAVNPSSETGLATKYKFPVKVGSALKYATTSTKYAAYNGREVALEDYITPYQIYYTKAFGMARGSENLSGPGSIKGTSSYYNGSGAGFDLAKFNSKVGIKAYVDENDGKSYLEFEFNLPCNPFMAMTYVSSGMFQPVPRAFIEAIGDGDFAAGTQVWGTYNADKSETPLDHWLSTGAYTLERWEDQQIVYKRNTFFQDGNRYKIPGIHMKILSALKTDPEAALKEFEANKLHSCGIPYTKLTEYLDDERVGVSVGDSNFKINLNTCDQDTWNELFGVEGTVDQAESEADYWECKPAMANKDFTAGISFAIDRQGLAAKVGRNAAFEYFAPTYLIDPENGIAYNDTEEHAAAVASIKTGTDGYGYSLEKAKAAFQKAAEDLIAEGKYEEGDEITLECWWQDATDEDEFHNFIKKNCEDAFNTEDNPLRLNLHFNAPAVWTDVYYKHMMVGQFDIGFGSISGNDYDPLGFMNVLSTNSSINHDFCLNWGVDTNAVTGADDGILYDNKYWSFDGLFMAANEGVYAKAGKNSDVENNVKNVVGYTNEDGSYTFEADFLEKKIKNDKDEVIVSSYVSNINLYAYYTAKQTSIDIPVLREDAVVTPSTGEGLEEYTHIKATFPADVIQMLNSDPYFVNAFAPAGGLMFDIYYAKDVFGITGNPTSVGSIYHLDVFPDAGEESDPEAWYVENDWDL